MKKLVLLFSILTIWGCEDKTSLDIQKNLQTVKLTGECGSIMVLDASNISNDPVWIENNRRYFPAHEPQINSAVTCTNRKYIDVNEFNVRIDELPDWLFQNGDYICYDDTDTSKFIECQHLITDEKHIAAIEKLPIRSTLTLGELQEKINKANGDFSDNYKHYVSFYFDILNNVQLKLMTPFYESENYYSIPLLRSIAKNNHLKTESKFQFRSMKINGKKKPVFSVEIAENVYKYYNFSQVPTKKREFSPF